MSKPDSTTPESRYNDAERSLLSALDNAETLAEIDRIDKKLTVLKKLRS